MPYHPNTISEPPPIPACRMPHIRSRGQHLLFWVHTGSAEVELAGGKTISLAEGEAAWIPARTDRALYTQSDTVAFPLLSSASETPSAPADVRRFTVPTNRRDHLIHHFVLGISPVTTPGYSRADLLIDVHVGRPTPTSRRAQRFPAFPHSKPADSVARELLRNPALDHSLQRWATLVACSPSKLGRDFRTGTGLGFARWRRAVRLAVAAELLAAGHTVAGVAARTGFATRRGFSCAFRTEYGYPPSQHPRDPAGPRSGGETLRSFLAADRGSVPSTYTAPRVNPFHVLLWMYRGAGHARVGDGRVHCTRGAITWLPAGIENQTGADPGGIWVPLGDLLPSDMGLTEPLRAQFSPSWERFLLYCSVTSYMMLRPEGYDYRHIAGLFDAQLARQRAASVQMPKNTQARTAALAFLSADRLPIAPPSITPATEQAFVRETGMTFSRWQHSARMRVARDLLMTEPKVGSVATRVGYTQLSNFSRAYTRFYGTPPSAHHRRG